MFAAAGKAKDTLLNQLIHLVSELGFITTEFTSFEVEVVLSLVMALGQPYALASPIMIEVVLPLLVLILIGCLLSRTIQAPPLGFILAGLIAGPHILGLVEDFDVINSMVELGALLLLFVAGTTFRLPHQQRSCWTLKLSTWQAALSIAFFGIVLLLFGVNWKDSLFTGLLAAVSFTPLALMWSTKRMAFDRPYWRIFETIYPYQTLVVLFLALVISLLGGAEKPSLGLFILLIACSTCAFLGVIIAKRKVIERFIKVENERGSRGLLTTVLILCLVVILIANMGGFGTLLGVFIAGLLLRNTRFKGRAVNELISLRTLCNLFFCVSLGMLFDPAILIEEPLLVIAATGAIILFRVVVVGGSMARSGCTSSVATRAALMAIPFGEFTFLLFFAGQKSDLSPAGLGMVGEQVFIAVCVLLFVVSPLLTHKERRLKWWLEKTFTYTHPQNDHPHEKGEQRELLVYITQSNEIEPSIQTVVVEAGAPVSGSSLKKIALWPRYGVLVLGIWRKDVYLAAPSEDYRLQPYDRLVLSGPRNGRMNTEHLFQSPTSRVR